MDLTDIQLFASQDVNWLSWSHVDYLWIVVMFFISYLDSQGPCTLSPKFSYAFFFFFCFFFFIRHPFLSKCLLRMRKCRKSKLIQKMLWRTKFWRQCVNIFDTTWVSRIRPLWLSPITTGGHPLRNTSFSNFISHTPRAWDWLLHRCFPLTSLFKLLRDSQYLRSLVLLRLTFLCIYILLFDFPVYVFGLFNLSWFSATCLCDPVIGYHSLCPACRLPRL